MYVKHPPLPTERDADDNVGGALLDAFLVNAANFARIIACGAISVRSGSAMQLTSQGYNGNHTPLKNAWQFVPRRLSASRRS